MSRANESAFPRLSRDAFDQVYTGLTIREHFAGLAMQGLLAGKYYGPVGELAEKAVIHADALIAELAK